MKFQSCPGCLWIQSQLYSTFFWRLDHTQKLFPYFETPLLWRGLPLHLSSRATCAIDTQEGKNICADKTIYEEVCNNRNLSHGPTSSVTTLKQWMLKSILAMAKCRFHFDLALSPAVNTFLHPQEEPILFECVFQQCSKDLYVKRTKVAPIASEIQSKLLESL